MTVRFLAFVLAAALTIPAVRGQTPAAQKNKPRAKKVWTNEDLEELRLRAPVSVVGQSSKSDKAAKEKETAAGDKKNERNAKWYRERLAPLRRELERVTEQIQQLQTGLANPASGQEGFRLGAAAPMVPPRDQLDQLNKRSKELQQQIEAIADQARRNGIELGSP